MRTLVGDDQPKMVVSRSGILGRVWGFSYDGTPDEVDVSVRSVRNRIDWLFSHSTVETVPGQARWPGHEPVVDRE